MKKIITLIMCLVCFVSAFTLAACNNTNDQGSNQETVDTEGNQDNNESQDTPADEIKQCDCIKSLADCEIGYQLPVYPNSKFEYGVEPKFVVSEISITLTAKNEMRYNNFKEFYPFEITVKIVASSNASVGYKYGIKIASMHTTFNINSIINEDGSIIWEEKIKGNISPACFYFNSIFFVAQAGWF